MELKLELDQDLYAQLTSAAIQANLSTEDFVINKLKKILNYKSKLPVNNPDDENNPFYAKALRRIPAWAEHKDQLNHKIIKAFFLSYNLTDGHPTIEHMESLCSQEDHPSLYIAPGKFIGNYRQMKYDGEKSHGKVFIDDGKNVILWDVISDLLLQYEDTFLNG